MVGRDTDNLDESGVVRACVESVAENLVDGTTAVLFWAFAAGLFGGLLGYPTIAAGALGAICYKAVNTLDSMYGYKNERYELFGWFAANLDDLANFVPARVSALCVIISAFLLGYDGPGSARVCAADRLKHSSPNSGHTEAAMAGALGIELGGPARYFGQEVVKPRLGEALGTPRQHDIGRANRLAIMASVLFYVACSLCYLFLLRMMLP
jgi:adenosylcobinamide-phosphate synthase